MRGRRGGGMQLDKADVEGGEVRKSEGGRGGGARSSAP